MFITEFNRFLKILYNNRFIKSMFFCAAFYFFCGLTKQYKIPDFTLKAFNPFVIGGILVISPPIKRVGVVIACIALIAASGFVPFESL